MDSDSLKEYLKSTLDRISISSSAQAVCENYSDVMLETLHKQFKAQEFCDVTLVFEGKEIRAHRAVLASSSRFFEVMFSSNFKDSKQERLELPALDYKTGTELIEFAYTGMINITADNVLGLLEEASFLEGFKFVEKSCCEFLKAELNVSNVLGILQIADMLNLKALKEFAKICATRNFMSIKDTDEFLQLQVSLLSELLSEDGLMVVQNGVVKLHGQQEKVILEALTNYLENFKSKHPERYKQVCVAELLGNVRLPLFDVPYLKELGTHHLFSGQPECTSLIDKAIEINEAKQSSNSTEVFDWGKPRWNGEFQTWKGRKIMARQEFYGTVLFEQFDDTDKIDIRKDYIVAMKIWIVKTQHGVLLEREQFGGIKVTYSNGWSLMHGSDRRGESHEFHLESGERITMLESAIVDLCFQIKFMTNNGRELDPFGAVYSAARDTGAADSIQEILPGHYQYLACVQGTVIKSTQGQLAINSLRFIWRVFRFPDEKTFPDHRDSLIFYNRQCDDSDLDEYDYESSDGDNYDYYAHSPVSFDD